MKLDGKQIRKYRQLKGLTQKELAEQTQLNPRTIQRLENNDTEARAFTIRQIAEVLDMPLNVSSDVQSKSLFWTKLINVVGLILLNFGIIFVFGFLTMDSEANLNSLFGAVLLSVFMPFGIYFFTQKLSKEERLLKYSLGLWLYILVFVAFHGPVVVLAKGLFYVVVFYSASLYLLPKLFDRLEKQSKS